MTRNRNTTSVLALEAAVRLPNSRNGNPRYRLHFVDSDGDRFSARTSSDAAVNYDIANLTNTRLRDQNSPLRVEFTPAGHVVYITPVTTVRYRTQYQSNAQGAGRIKVTWRDRNGTRRQKAVPYPHELTGGTKHAYAVAQAAGVTLDRVNPTADVNVFNVDF